MSHTPGPWAYDADSCEVFGTTEGRSCGWVAKVVGGDSNDCRLPYDERVANARLIAAAPDLLAACKALAHDIRAMQFTDGEYRLSLDSARSILALLDREISKAEGEVINECD